MDDTTQALWVIMAGLNDHEGYCDPTVHGPYPSAEAAEAAAVAAFGPRPSDEDIDMYGPPENGSLWEVVSVEPIPAPALK